MRNEFEGRTAFVTGSGGGMGLQLTLDLIARGANVAAIDVKPTPEELKSKDGRLLYIQADVGDEVAVHSAVKASVQRFGPMHYLANVAGVLWFNKDMGAAEVELDVWNRVFAINLLGVVHTVRHCLPTMLDKGGSMVHVSTVQHLRGDTKPQDAYQASKAGVCALSRSLAIQYARRNIRSNTVLPGITQTPLQSRWSNDDIAAASAVVPLGRVGTATDMSDAMIFLLSDSSSYITGIDLVVDGGLTMKPP